MAESIEGGAYLGADGVLHDANGKPIVLHGAQGAPQAFAGVPVVAPSEPTPAQAPAPPPQPETLVQQTERLAQRAIPRKR